MMKQLGVALVGFGMAGRVFHAPLIGAVEGLDLRTIVQRRGDEARDRYPSVSIARDIEAVLGDNEIDLIVVATPTASHFELARRALLADKHVVVDKPFTVTSTEADAIIELARERKKIVTVFHNRRWDGDFLTVRALLTESPFGRLVEYESRFDRFRNRPRAGAWRESSGPGSGVLYDLGSHLIDQTLVLFGMPETINADVRTERDFGDADDAFDIRMQYGTLRVTLAAGMLRRERTPRFLLRGTDATFLKYGLDPQEAALAAGQTPGSRDWGREPREHWGTLLREGEQQPVEGVILSEAKGHLATLDPRKKILRFAQDDTWIETHAGNYPAFYENVRDAILGRAQLEVAAEDARTTIRIIELAFESSRNASSVRMRPPDQKPSSDRSTP